jgi:hypothetical protein
MDRRRYFLLTPILVVLVGALVLTLDAPASKRQGQTLTFTVGGEEVTAPIEPAIIRRRTITPEFDPPLDLVAGRVVFARGFIACDPGEVFVVNVVVTQDGSTGQGRTAGVCTGETQVWTAVVPARSRAGFEEGPAEACAVATTRRRGITDTFQWCGQPELTSADFG